MSDFLDLKKMWVKLAETFEDAQEAIEHSPCAALEKLSEWVYLLVRVLLSFEGINAPTKGNAATRLNILTNRGLLPTTLIPFFHVLNSLHKISALPENTARMRVKRCLKIAVRLSIWFVKSYGTHLPSSISNIQDSEEVIQTIHCK